MFFYFNFQPVIVIHKGQVVIHAMIVVYANVMIMLPVTNVMHVLLVFLNFLHVQVSNTRAFPGGSINWGSINWGQLIGVN